MPASEKKANEVPAHTPPPEVRIPSRRGKTETLDPGRSYKHLANPGIVEITPMAEEALVLVTLLINRDDGDGVGRRQIRLMSQQYADLRPAVGEVTPEFADTLIRAGALCDAIRKGIELLGYGAMSRRRLSQKLTLRKMDAETVSAALDYLETHGYLTETDDAIRFAEQGVKKLWGPRRIKEDLFARGFPSEAVSDAMASLEEVDFSENCARVIVKKYGACPTDYAQRRKMIAALMRLGYTSDHIREAMK